MVAGLVIAVSEVVLLLSADLILGADLQLHASGWLIFQGMLLAVGSIIPQRVTDGLVALVGLLSLNGWLLRQAAPAVTVGSSSPDPILGAILGAPVYAVVRRLRRPAASDGPERIGAPPHRVYQAVLAKAPEPVLGRSTGVPQFL